MKKVIITAIMIFTIIATAIPFSSVKAQVAATSQTGQVEDVYDNVIGNWDTTIIQSNNSNDYINLDVFGIVGNYDMYRSGAIINVHLDDYYTGTIHVSFTNSNFTLYWVEGEGIGNYYMWFSNSYMSIYLVNCCSFTVYVFSQDFNANIQTSFVQGSDDLSIYNLTETVIATSDKIKNVRLTVFGSPNQNATADILENHYIYTSSLPSNYTMNRIDIKFNYSEIVNGNYLVFTFYILSGSQYTPADFGQDLFVRNHSNTLFNISSQCYKDLFISWNSSTGKGVYLITYYVPTSILTSSTYLNQGDWQFSTYTFTIQNAEQVGWIYRGIVETVPDKLNGKADTNDLDTITDDFTDITDQEHDITEGFMDSLDDFNESVDLQDYDFITGLGLAGNYFKLQLENVFNQSVNLRAMWVLPVICIVFLALLGGRP